MSGKFVTNGNAWGHPHKVVDALCEDGKRRTVRLNQQADTYFSWSGRCSINGKTTRGYVTSSVDDNGDCDIEFHIYKGE